ncbi:MAG: hypothetical protein M3O36_17110, partial [Myxococcota bacterium]|nr:hypothetical protein [Myxococcota bacterium]
PAGVSVYASHDPAQAVTVAVVVNKMPAVRALTLAPDAAPRQSFDFPGSSISVVRLPDAGGAATHVTQYTQAMAAAGLPPAQVR